MPTLERKRLAEHLRKLAAGEKSKEVSAALRRRAELIEAGGDGAGSDLDALRDRPPLGFP